MSESEDKVTGLVGTYRHKVDDKGRVSLPSSFRRVFQQDLVVTLEPGGECLYVFEPEGFDQWVAKLLDARFSEFDETNRSHLMLRRVLRARASNALVDTSGRIMLTVEQRTAVGIDKDVVIVGNSFVGDSSPVGYFEIWDASRYDQLVADFDLGFLLS